MTENRLCRRDVIKTLLVTSAASVIGGKAWAVKVVSDVTANAIDPTVGVARLQLSSFPALDNNGGSVRLGSSGISANFPVGLFYPIIINRISATEYVALESQCLHAGCVVGTLSGGVNGRMGCPCHGSQYDAQGKCVVGPAPVGFFLRSFPTTIEGGMLKIDIADQGFSSLMTSIDSNGQTRLQISWDSFSFVEYQLRYRPNFATEPVVVNFATTPTGATTTSFITGNDTAATETGARKIYVVPQDGIYQVAIRWRAV
jgi:Rieske Fe-S protein